MLTLDLFNRIKSEFAYRRFQSEARARINQAKAKHGKVNKARAEQTAMLHAALAGRGR